MKKIVRVIPLVVVYSLIIYFSVKIPSGKPSIIPYMDKVGHFIAYFTLGFTILLSLRFRISRGIFLVLSLGLGIALEFIQGQLTYRHMSFEDGLSNFLGLLFGVVFYIIFKNQIKKALVLIKFDRFFLE